MRPSKFFYYAPRTLKEAINILYEKEDSKILAGGQSLITMMKMRVYSPKHIVDIKKIPELTPRIEPVNDHIEISSLTTHDMIATSPVINNYAPILAKAARNIADQQIRNRGTIGGNIAHADPSSNLPVALLVLGAKLKTISSKGEREIDFNNFYLDMYTTALDKDEIITRIIIPKSNGLRQEFMKIGMTALTWPMAIIGIGARLQENGLVEDIKIALGSAGPIPLRAYKTEEYLKGKRLNEETILEATKVLDQEVNPFSDVHASKEYRKHLIKTLFKRSIYQILVR